MRHPLAKNRPQMLITGVQFQRCQHWSPNFAGKTPNPLLPDFGSLSFSVVCADFVSGYIVFIVTKSNRYPDNGEPVNLQDAAFRFFWNPVTPRLVSATENNRR